MIDSRSTVDLPPEQKYPLDYEQTTRYFHELSGLRFKILLGVFPVMIGAAIALLSNEILEEVRRGVAALGLLATIGVMFYDQRNTAIYNAMQRRAKLLEAIMQFEPSMPGRRCGGPFLDRPLRTQRFYGIPMWHDLGLAIIYSSAISAWVYLLVNSLPVPRTPIVSVVAAVGAWLLVFFGLMRLDEPTDAMDAMPVDIRPLIWPDDGQDDGGKSKGTDDEPRV